MKNRLEVVRYHSTDNISDVHKRALETPCGRAASAAAVQSREAVEALITAEITSILPELATRRRGISDESIVQLGIDSLDIRVLVQNVNSKLGVDLPRG